MAHDSVINLMLTGTRPFSTRRGRSAFASRCFRGSIPFPTIPHWKCPVVPCPSKILLRNATSTLSISESGAPVRGLRPKSRPFVIAAKLAVPIFCYDRFLPMFHLASA